MSKSRINEITPATMTGIRPGAQVVQLSREEEELLNTMAKKYNIDKIELMNKLINNATTASTPKLAVTNQSLEKIQQLRDKGALDNSKSNPINDLLQYGLYKDLRKDMIKSDDGRMSTREMMEMNMINMQMLMMQKATLYEKPDGNNQSQNQLNLEIEKMRHEQEKTRLEYEAKLKEQDAKHQAELNQMKTEKKLDDIHNSVLGEIDRINKRLDLQSKIPFPGNSNHPKDPIKELEDMGGKMRRVKEALGSFFPTLNSTAPATPPAPYRNPDGSTDWVGVIERVGPVIQKTVESFGKKTPDMGQVVNTPGSEASDQINERRLTMEEYSEILIAKPRRTPEEQQWLLDYYEHLSRESDKLESAVSGPEEIDTEQEMKVTTPTSIVDFSTRHQEPEKIEIKSSEDIETFQEKDMNETSQEGPEIIDQHSEEQQPGEEDKEQEKLNNSNMVDKIKEKDEATRRNTAGFL